MLALLFLGVLACSWALSRCGCVRQNCCCCRFADVSSGSLAEPLAPGAASSTDLDIGIDVSDDERSKAGSRRCCVLAGLAVVLAGALASMVVVFIGSLEVLSPVACRPAACCAHLRSM